MVPLRAAFAAAALLLACCPAEAQTAPAYVPRAEDVDELPAGPGREETFGLCAACHNYRLVANQGQTRAQWDDTLTYMTKRHNMPDVQGTDRDVILDYLATHHGPKAVPSTGGFRNPFAGQN